MHRHWRHERADAVSGTATGEEQVRHLRKARRFHYKAEFVRLHTGERTRMVPVPFIRRATFCSSCWADSRSGTRELETRTPQPLRFWLGFSPEAAHATSHASSEVASTNPRGREGQ